LALKFIPKIKNKFDVVFSISSVLDLVIFSYFLKLKNPKIIWCTILDNIVPISDPGNKIIRFLAWLFFQVSIFLIKKADIVFVVSPSLKEYLIWRRFNSSSIIITGNGIDTKTLQKAKGTSSKYDCLFIGRLNETKGIFDMLDVVYKIKNKIPNFKLAIIGQGDNLTKIN
jgi:glycosyltransferase involved in cell wall biosynthesis